MPGQNGKLIRTFSGLELDPFNLKFDQIKIEDIAHSHACTNRFCGHTRRPITVAQHCVYVARIAFQITNDKSVARQALLHDATETYIGDVTRWLKRTVMFEGYRHFEETLQEHIYTRFNLPTLEHPSIKMADRIMVRFEGIKGFGPDFWIEHPDYPRLSDKDIELVGKWSPWGWKSAEDLFLTHWRMYQP